MKTWRWTLFGSLVLGLWLAACGGTGSQTGIAVTEAWARPSPMAERAGAAYMLITNGGSIDDRLISVTTDVAATVELHETKNEGGMMAMAPVDGITIPANGRAELKPGGYHVMLIDLTHELKVGETIDLVLEFEQAGELEVTVEVRDE